MRVFFFAIQWINMLALLIITFPVYAQGINQPEAISPYLNGAFPNAIPGSTTSTGSYILENAFPNLTFIAPIKIIDFPGNQKLVLGRLGHVWLFNNNENANTKSEVLNIRNQVEISGDAGALGVALHPQFEVAGADGYGELFIYYRYKHSVVLPGVVDYEHPAYIRLSRFNFNFNNQTIDANSEFVLIQQFDEHGWHNGGDLFFGMDDFLYFTNGDAGGSNDAYNVTQKIDDRLFSGLFRIDVDQKGGAISHPIRRQPQQSPNMLPGWPNSFTQGYFIPNDNPWLSTAGAYLEEFYALGLRSPHRATLDPSGKVWVGDVGQATKEEISLIEKGDNLQWPYKEGYSNGPANQPVNLIGTEKSPALDYVRTFGRCVIGGYRIAGNAATKYPGLSNKYIFADHITKNIYVFDVDQDDKADNLDFLLNLPSTGRGISSFGLGNDGTVFVLELAGWNADGGKIYKLESDVSVSQQAPNKLADTGIFTNMNTLQTAPGIIPYDVNAPLWSDGASKTRWIALPNNGTHNTADEQIIFDEEENWAFPEGTVTIKHFDLPVDANNPQATVRLETRFFVLTPDGGYGLTYRWNDAGTEAFLIDQEEQRDITVTLADGTQINQTWVYPSRQQCMDCHNSDAGFALGLKTRQLNKDYTYASGTTDNQLNTWESLGMFHANIGSIAQLPQSSYITDATASAEQRVRSYIDGNCSYCHRPNSADAVFDGRSLTPLTEQQMLNVQATGHNALPGDIVIIPGDANNSLIKQRDESTGTDKMPPLGRLLTDQTYIDELSNWINGLVEPVAIPDGWYNIALNNTINVLSTLANGNIEVAPDQSNTNQKWNIQKIGENYLLVSEATNMVLSTQNMEVADGVTAIEQDWTGKQNQLWYFTPYGNQYKITNAYSGLVLDGSVASSTKTHLLATNTKQLWTLIPTTGNGNNDFCIEAEDFDITGGNFDDGFAGGPGLGVNATANIINFVNNDDWTEYSFNAPATGDYAIEYLLATPESNAAIQFILDGTIISTDAVPVTGGWGTYIALSAANNIINLSVGNHTLRIVASGTNAWQWNLNNICMTFISNCAFNSICNDGNLCTTGETFDVNCNCSGGIFQDADNDGVCDANDVCPAGDDNMDLNMDGVPDACYVCLNTIVDTNNPNILYDREANVSISTNGKVLNGVDVDYHAGQIVELLNNFEVETGADFHAFIANCNQ